MVYRFDRALGKMVHQVTVALETDRQLKLKQFAAATKRTVNEVLRERLIDWIDEINLEDTEEGGRGAPSSEAPEQTTKPPKRNRKAA